MNKVSQFIKKTAACIILAFAAGGWAHAEVNPKPFVIPELKTWEGAEGRFTPSGRIITEGNSKELQQVAKALSADYSTMFGRDLKIGKGKAKVGDIVLSLKNIFSFHAH
jgi:hexosaminidase